ncbi:type IV pilin N-terminal domain-containing protein [Methanolobus psychrotolerans]|uniref:type IV pilin N-terminal domain-containing protein n=1 Tax=Methanolobus psychrotolerans TaxID=1874706 RepID=UPI000B91752D|nr:type IV pilin N-terminal domain-containing protein [Methanolobus psychrotolerans]
MASEMIGEVLKLALVVTLAAVLSISIYALLPDERPPYLEIEMSFNQSEVGIIDITHVGGDPIRTNDVHIEISNASNMFDKKDYKLTELTNQSFWKFPETLFLNASTDSSSDMNDVKVTVVHQRAIISIGEVKKV